jgi:hypothetical protein
MPAAGQIDAERLYQDALHDEEQDRLFEALLTEGKERERQP